MAKMKNVIAQESIVLLRVGEMIDCRADGSVTMPETANPLDPIRLERNRCATKRQRLLRGWIFHFWSLGNQVAFESASDRKDDVPPEGRREVHSSMHAASPEHVRLHRRYRTASLATNGSAFGAQLPAVCDFLQFEV
jgi:hypothetical protein